MRDGVRRIVGGVLLDDRLLEVLNLEAVLLVEHVVDCRQTEILVRAAIASDVVVANGIKQNLADRSVDGIR